MRSESSQSTTFFHGDCQGCFSETNMVIDELKVDEKNDKTSFLLGNYKHLSNHLIPYALIPVKL